MPTLQPFRQYAEAEVLNLFAYSGTIPVNKGTVVKFVGSGWRTEDADLTLLGPVGASFPNTLSTRWGILPSVTPAGTGDLVAGMLLHDVREQDENGELLKYNPRKAAELQCTISGQVTPLLVRGFVLYSGSQNGGYTAGATAYPSGAGEITTTSTNSVPASVVGKFYGAPDSFGCALLYVSIV